MKGRPFEKGKSGNPGSRPKVIPELRHWPARMHLKRSKSLLGSQPKRGAKPCASLRFANCSIVAMVSRRNTWPGGMKLFAPFGRSEKRKFRQLPRFKGGGRPWSRTAKLRAQRDRPALDRRQLRQRSKYDLFLVSLALFVQPCQSKQEPYIIAAPGCDSSTKTCSSSLIP